MTDITARLSTALADRYKIEHRLGEGGMATVYLAEDLKHKRKVAVKVLRPELAAVLGAERFVQEITTTANLQHPHILPLHDSGDADGFLYYVMPFIDGETLRDKLNRETQLGIEEAVKITTEVADALDYAHRHNVIHRDIKPENILLHDGRPMVADFGIALAVSAAAGGRMTETGLSLGTPHYMSPEQATAEKDLTHRSDIYSLGSVLYEMLTGEPPHMGNSAQQIIMKIVTDTPRPVTELRKSVPANVTAAVAKSLERLAADRFATAKEFAEALTNPAFTLPATQLATVAGASTSGQWKRVSIGLAALAAVLLGTTLWGWLQPEPPRPVVRYSIGLPAGQGLAGRFDRVALAPDGSAIVYTGEGDHLWLRPRDQLEATPLAETGGAEAPFFSPDGNQVGFFVGGTTLKVVSLRGGPPRTVTDSLVGFAGGSWGANGFMYVDGFGLVGLVRVAAAGGTPVLFTHLDSSRGESDHTFPQVLPNGKGVLFRVGYGDGRPDSIAVADVATGTHSVLLHGVAARYAPSGHLLYVTADGALMSVPFDQDAMAITGDPTARVEGVAVGQNATADIALSATGTLMYATQTDEAAGAEVVWIDRDGTVEPVDPGWTDAFMGLALSPDGSRLAVTIEASSGPQIYIKRLDRRGSPSRLTFEGRSYQPAWTADGRSVAFISDRNGNDDIYIRPADGSGVAELILDVSRSVEEFRYTRDGAWLVYHVDGGSTLFALRLDADSPPVPLSARGIQPVVSPDGRWLAYASTEDGFVQVYVRPFPRGDGLWQISTNGGFAPFWGSGGRELIYRNADWDVVAVTVEVAPDADTFEWGPVETSFSGAQYETPIYNRQFDVAADGRIVAIRSIGGNQELIVVENFVEELKARVGN